MYARLLAVAVLAVCSSLAGSFATSVQAACGVPACYVSSQNGSDSDSYDGTANRPWQTIKYALEKAPNGTAKIVVKAGLYEEVVRLNKPSITLEGETDPATGTRPTIDGSLLLTGEWKEVLVDKSGTTSGTGVYQYSLSKTESCSGGELLIEDSTTLSGGHVELAPTLTWKRVIRLDDRMMSDVLTYPTDNDLFRPENEGWDEWEEAGKKYSKPSGWAPVGWWDGVDALWGCSVTTASGSAPPQASLYLRFRHPHNPVTHNLRRGPVLKGSGSDATVNGNSVVVVAASGVTVRNFNIRGGFYGVHVGEKGGDVIDGVVIENNLVSGGAEQIKVSYRAKGTVIRNNELTANLLGNKQGCKTGVDPNCWTAGAWAYRETLDKNTLLAPQWPTGIAPDHIRVRKHVHDVTRHRGVQQLSAIAINGAGPGTTIEDNQIHDGIGGIVIENTAPLTYVRDNTIRRMTHFGILARCGANGSIFDNRISDVNAPLRFQDLNIPCETAPRAISIHKNTSYLPPYVGEHMFFHWLQSDIANPDPPRHALHFYRNIFCGGYVGLVINGDFDPLVGLGGSRFINNAFATDYFMFIFAGKAEAFLANKMIETFSDNRVAVRTDADSPNFPSPFPGKNSRPLWLDNTPPPTT